MSSKFYLVAAAYQKQTTHEDNKQKKHPTRHRNKWFIRFKNESCILVHEY